jgi:immune inhibitor A
MKIMNIVLVLLAVLTLSSVSYGVSIAPEIVEQLKQSGQLQAIVDADRVARGNGVWAPNSRPYRNGAAADIDTLHCLIILVDFTDMTHEANLHSEPGDFDSLLFSMGERTPGSMTDYYFETSYGQAYLTGQVTPWFRMPETYAYYVDGQRGFGNYPHNAQKLAEDAVLAADSVVDFSQFDNNGDGWVDALFVVHAGPGYEDTGNLNYIHSHAWGFSHSIELDGVQLSSYSMEPEETGSHTLVHIGVFCHEFGHVLGLPDLYDYDYDSDGVGVWSIMAGGSWGGGGVIPVHFDGWSKCQLGWVLPTVLMDNMDSVQIDEVEYNQDIYQLFSEGSIGPEYFLVENRQRELFDVSIPGGGLLIYHIDESAPNNNDQTHYKVAVEQADGLYDLEHNRGGNSGDPWPGLTNNFNFDDFTVPNSNLYGGAFSQVSVKNISNSDSTMYADLGIFSVNPLFELLSFSINDSLGNNNGRPEAGENCKVVFSARNIRAWVDQFTVTLNCSEPLATFSDSISQFGAEPVNEPFDNSADPVWFSLPPNFTSSFGVFSLTFTARGGLYTQTLTYRIIMGSPELVLIDGDNGTAIDTFYTRALYAINEPFVYWNVNDSGSPAAILTDYRYAIWFTGNSNIEPFPSEDVEGLINFLNHRGRLLFTSQDFVQRLYERGSARDSLLLNQYLKVSYNTRENDHHGTGQPGSPYDTLVFLTSGSGGANNQTSQDSYTIWPGGQVALAYRTGTIAGVAVIDSYVTMTVGFGAEGANDGFPNLYGTMRAFIQRSLNFLRDPVAVDDGNISIPQEFSLLQNYPNPFNPSTTISFVMPVAGDIELSIYDITGRLIDMPFKGHAEAGRNDIVWNGATRPSGVYFYRITTPTGSETRRMILVK